MGRKTIDFGIDLGTTNSVIAVSYTHLDVYKRQVHTIERCLGRQIIIVLRAQDAVKEPYSAPPPVIDRRCATRRGVYQGWELSVLRVHGGASQSGLGKRCQAGPRRFR